MSMSLCQSKIKTWLLFAGVSMYKMQAFFLVLSLFLSSCATDGPNMGTNSGAIGSAAGAVAGHQLKDDQKGALIGAAVGAIAGAMVGNYMDEQQRTFESSLEKERKAGQVKIERLEDDSMRLNLRNEISFEFDSAEIKADFEPALEKMGELIVEYNQTVVHIIGHSDNGGATEYNMLLSKKRADGVARFFAQKGVPDSRMKTEGRGDTEPRESNETEEGKELNRRVEIYVKPIIKGKEKIAYEAPRY